MTTKNIPQLEQEIIELRQKDTELNNMIEGLASTISKLLMRINVLETKVFKD